MLGFCKGNKMISSAIWCEKIKSEIFKEKKTARALFKINLQVLRSCSDMDLHIADMVY